ncbi:uncharacterized protein VP01_1711g5 [Puccinia sorghi]|uniref:Required for respiratory growth protein 9, mitochondrial n=1 Tax=Puccinia sorghi TaxID=27349 RepID=A0A0L6VG46_9BASI|nr:uncharacterized protein VP01_1711g5 [Puccinia sorghi]
MLRRATGITGSRICHQRAPKPSALAGQATQAGPSVSKTDAEGVVQSNGGVKSEREKPHWQIHKEALRRNFPSGWNPPKKISRPAMALLRTLHRTDPHQFSLPVLADKFKISPEAVRRILKSKWEPDHDSLKKIQDRQQSIRLPTSHDGWIHHEKLETDHIPLNLAHTLQSSPQQQHHSPEYSSISTGTRAPSRRPHNALSQWLIFHLQSPHHTT